MNVAAKILLDSKFKGATMVGIDGYMNPCVYIGRESIAVNLSDQEQTDTIKGWLVNNYPQVWEEAEKESNVVKETIEICLAQFE